MMSTQTALETLAKAYDYHVNYEEKVKEAAILTQRNFGYLDRESWVPPEFGLVLGSGLGYLADAIEDAKVVPYKHITNVPKMTVSGHEGTIVYGTIEGVSVIGLKGRKHYYEVADEPFNTGILQTVFPVHILATLGVKNYFATNAAGGLNEGYFVGDIMAIDTHINLLPNPLLGKQHGLNTIEGKKPLRFQPMNNAYDKELTNMLFWTGGRDAVHSSHCFGGYMRIGTYLATAGPSYETNGESLAFRALGADAVGMSTAPEVIVARNRGMKCVAMSCITNKIAPDGTNATSHEEVKAILDSEKIRNRLASTIRNFFASYRKVYK